MNGSNTKPKCSTWCYKMVCSTKCLTQGCPSKPHKWTSKRTHTIVKIVARTATILTTLEAALVLCTKCPQVATFNFKALQPQAVEKYLLSSWINSNCIRTQVLTLLVKSPPNKHGSIICTKHSSHGSTTCNKHRTVSAKQCPTPLLLDASPWCAPFRNSSTLESRCRATLKTTLDLTLSNSTSHPSALQLLHITGHRYWTALILTFSTTIACN